MNMVIRQVFVGLLVSFLLAVLLLTATFMAFPIKEWSSLWEIRIFDVPYIMLVFTITTGAGIISGMSYGWFWRGKFQTLYHQLDVLVRGQKLTITEKEPIKEMEDIQQQLMQLDEKLKKQTELSQRQATERAQEREKSLQEVVAQERNRLARELHDSVSQQLFAASMLMSAINEADPSEGSGVKKQLNMVEKMIHQSQLEMRALLLHLRPVALKGKTLQEGMEELLRELTQKVPMEITWKIETFDLDKGVEDQLFRILQESVSNTLRHANANSLNIMLIIRDETVIMRLVDDGIGFDMEEGKTSSYGLQNMQERAIEVGGTLKIISLTNQGTRLEVKVPHFKKEGSTND